MVDCCGAEVAGGNEKDEVAVVAGAVVFAPAPIPSPRPPSPPKPAPRPGVCDVPEEAAKPPNGLAADVLLLPNKGLKAEAAVALEAGWLAPLRLNMVGGWEGEAGGGGDVVCAKADELSVAIEVQRPGAGVCFLFGKAGAGISPCRLTTRAPIPGTAATNMLVP